MFFCLLLKEKYNKLCQKTHNEEKKLCYSLTNFDHNRLHLPPLPTRYNITAWIFLSIVLYMCWMNSGFKYEKPINSVWSRFIINNLSVGVRSIFSEVNCLSKLLTSLRCFCNDRNNKLYNITTRRREYIWKGEKKKFIVKAEVICSFIDSLSTLDELNLSKV